MEATEVVHAQSCYRLYIFPFSLYSMMARFTFTLGKTTSNVNNPLPIELVLVNLHRDENIAEEYLISVNANGQVPALTGPGLDKPLTDSLDISYWSCRFYPKLLPKEHEKNIGELLSDLHNIQALSLSVRDKNARREGVPCPAVDTLLANGDIGTQDHQALQYKREFHKKHLEFALEDENVASAEAQAKGLFTSVMALLETRIEKSKWLLGNETGPTLLDAHLAPFIIRLLDCGRSDLVPERLQVYAKDIANLPSWYEVTHRRSTLWDVSVGHVHLLKNI